MPVSTTPIDNADAFSKLNTMNGNVSMASLAESNPDEAAKLIKILNLAASGTAGEAEAALSKAMKMAARFDIDFSMLSPEKVEQWNRERIVEPVIEKKIKVAKGHFRRPPCSKYVIRILDEFFNVFTLTQHDAPSTLLMYGKKSALVRAEYVLFFLIGAFNRLWAKHQLETGASTNARDDFFRGLWIGFDKKLTSELEDTRAQAFAAAETAEERREFEKRYALVVTDSKKLLAEEAEKKVGKIVYKTAKRKPITDWSTYEAGFEEGKKLSIHEGLKNRGGAIENKNHIG